ncbi:glycosyltransferase family 4 protein [Paenibacillus sp. 23TSA30-6]|uniref:glycosyltransferase family 4 protein n=1 Tax=Paenibacillus sp. 23TSA30-6 TaxID=2546104 RepID=UPI001788642B|nr:glycosyltransferase family 4 protein [Paenibacillus sp. 23TSA30-6]MBE0335645.1 glycosyltransferase family 1 protein [Paenibacillus sp. 23TSA30-6]
MQRPKVAVVTPGSFVIPSPRSSSVERVIAHMVPLASDKLQVQIYGIRGDEVPDNADVDGVPCIRYKQGPSYVPEVIADLKRWSPAVVDVHNRPAVAYAIHNALPNSRIVLTLHSTTFIREPHLKRKEVDRLLQPLERIIVNSAYMGATVATDSSDAVRERIAINELGIHPGDFLPRWTPAAEAVRTARLNDYGWAGRRIVLYAGRLVSGKGVHRLLKALPGIVRACPDVLLLIAGSAYYGQSRFTPYSASLHRQTRKLRLGKHVKFLDYVPHPALASLYQLADVTVVPSVGSEAFGLVNLEAMAAGVPVVASRTGGIPEVVRHGETGWLVSPSPGEQEMAAAVIGLLQQPDLRRRMGEAGIAEVRKRFLWQHSSQRWAQIMLDCVT